MDSPLPPVQLVSYTQLRLTAGEGTLPYGSVRRFRVNLSSQPVRSERWFVQFFSKDNNQSPTDDRLWLHDLSFRKTTPAGTWTIGQFRPPFSRQRLLTDRELLVPDRATASDLLSPSGGLAQSFGRDLGVQWERSGLSLGLFRGGGALQQAGFGSSDPLLVGRATRQLGTLQWGGSFSARRSHGQNLGKIFVGATRFSGWDTRVGVDALFQQSGWRWSAEYLVGRLEGTLQRRAEGGYTDLVRTLSPHIELVAQAQTFSPSIGTDGLTVGVNVLPHDRRNRIQLCYVAQRQKRVELQVQQFLTPR